jgi:hypothetical protein
MRKRFKDNDEDTTNDILEGDWDAKPAMAASTPASSS